ncbi:MAG: ATP-binding protein [Gemmatimonadota bacterium]|nr:ATP-binding protein [Gemmatimonadota bacterium]
MRISIPIGAPTAVGLLVPGPKALPPRLAEAQGGTLTYSDRHGGGAIFELRLPVATP